MQRVPRVAGQFYPRDAQALHEEVARHIEPDAAKRRVIGVVSPHAGFAYSGNVAGAVYSRIEIPDTVILLGPNHSGEGERFAMMAEGGWSMPFGEVRVDGDLAETLLAHCPLLKDDFNAHLNEHSLETQLPFLQFFRGDFKIVPICFNVKNLETLTEVSRALAAALADRAGSALLVASSDMTHYQSHAEAEKQDGMAIKKILARDAEGLLATVKEHRISMCGVGPVATMLLTANQLGAKGAEAVCYQTSGEVTGDWDRVVGYAGVLVH